MKKKLLIAAVLYSLAIPGVLAQEALPLGWHSTDIGAQDIPGSTTYDPDAELFTLESTGDQIFRPDNLHFAYSVQTGNFEIITLVSYIRGMAAMGYSVSPAEEAGVMIREDLSPFSNTYYLSVVGGEKGGIRYYVRNNDDLDKMRHPGEGASGMLVPCWLKLKRIGNSFDSYFSQDGINWIYSPDANVSIEMNPTCYVGLWCRGNANYVELFGWENPNNESILSMVSEFEATRIEEIENIYTVQNPIAGYFAHILKDTSFLDVSNVFGKLDNDEIIYTATTSDIKICRTSVMEESDSILVRPKGIGSCSMTLTGLVSSINQVNHFPVFVWEAPEGWNSHDLGTMKTDGFTLKEGGLFTIGGSADISTPVPGEGSHYMHRTLDGDAEITARILASGFATSGAMGGISFKADSVVPDAAMARLVYTGEGTARFESRSLEGDTVLLQAESDVSIPSWIRMKKVGTLLNAYLSEDGETWTELGTGLNLDLGAEFEGGLMVGSSDNDNLSTLVFEEVSLDHTANAVNNPVTGQRMTVGVTTDIDLSGVFGHDGLPVISVDNSDQDVVSSTLAGSTLTLSGLAPGEAEITLSMGDEPDVIMTGFTVTVTEALEADWMFEDIGEALREGYPASLGDQAYSISTFGTGISGVSDHCSFFYKEKTGAHRIVAGIEAIEDRGAGSQAGIMFRESTDPGSLYILYTVTAYEGIKLQYRWDNQSTPVVEVTDPEITAPCWLKLERDEYNYFSASYSLDGETWTPHGEFSVPLELPATALVGLTATSGFNEGSSVFENVEMSQVTGIMEMESAYPVRVDHFPNPFIESATLRIDVTEQTDMKISLFNIAGIRVAELMNEQVNPGRHHILLNAAELSSGTYYYRVVTPGYVITNKIVKIR